MNAIEAYSMGFLTLDEFRALQHGVSINNKDMIETNSTSRPNVKKGKATSKKTKK